MILVQLFQFSYIRSIFNINTNSKVDEMGWVGLRDMSGSSLRMWNDQWPWLLLILIMVFSEQATRLGSEIYQPPSHWRSDGVEICYLFEQTETNPKRLQMALSDPRRSRTGLTIGSFLLLVCSGFESYGFILVATSALLAGLLSGHIGGGLELYWRRIRVISKG